MRFSAKLLLQISLVLTGILLFNHDRILEESPFIFEKSCEFFSLFCLSLGLGWFYIAAQRNPKRADLKILDWALICFFLCMMPIFEVLGLPPLITVPFLPFLVAGRLFVNWYLKKDDFQWFDLALFFTFVGVGMALAMFGMIGKVSKSTGYVDLAPSALVAVAISLTITRLIITWWKRKRSRESLSDSE